MSPRRPSPDDTLSFRAAFEWTCSHAAWLPRQAPATESELLDVAERRVARACGPGLRAAVLEAIAGGRVLLQATPGGVPGPPLGDAEPPARGHAGRIVTVHALGILDERMLPLWISRALARGLADELGGQFLTNPSLRASPVDVLDAPPGETPPFALIDHVLVLSAADPSGRGGLTTCGMGRLGLPEFEVRNVPLLSLRAMAAAVNGLAWHVLDATLATPAGRRGERQVTLPADVRVERAWIQASLGPGSGVTLPAGGDGEARVRLRRLVRAGGIEWIQAEPPAEWHAGRKAWARSIADALGIAWGPPPGVAAPRGRGD